MTRDPSQYLAVSHSDGTTILKVLDSDVLADAKEVLYSFTEGDTTVPMSSQVVLNLENVRMLKSVMLATLINFQKKIKDKGGSLKLCCVDPDVLRLMRLTHIDELLDIRQDEREAIGTFQPSSSPGWLSRLFGSK